MKTLFTLQQGDEVQIDGARWAVSCALTYDYDDTYRGYDLETPEGTQAHLAVVSHGAVFGRVLTRYELAEGWFVYAGVRYGPSAHIPPLSFEGEAASGLVAGTVTVTTYAHPGNSDEFVAVHDYGDEQVVVVASVISGDAIVILS